MQREIQIGSVVQSTLGKDSGRLYLVIGVTQTRVEVVDGKFRKINRTKLKNKKHIKVIISKGEKTLAERIIKGEAVSNRGIQKVLAEKEKI